ncbi:hypothetical protein EZV62_023968 [Acer yangbiense]|uniref:SWIM-type domain-containing protein n=1 Tax=Acer yangbiense TaxID=1000413 RepID=A0A5C7H380_9ROSI|nr:hypothetical protein EZV62_023968 [Acer yangbiense]
MFRVKRMGPVVISAKFAGIQIEYNVLEPEIYTLAALWADVYVISYSNFPDPNEKFTTEAILPWHVAVGDSDINTDDEQLSNAASFNEDLYAIFEDNSDDESQTKPYVPKPGKPFRVADDGKVYLQVEQLFRNLYHFRMVLRDFVVQEGFQILRVKNEKDRHACQKVHKNQEANDVWVANRFKSLIEENPDININFLGSEIHRFYGITIPTWTLYRAKNRVLDSTTIEYAECYDKLYSYGHMVRETNPGSVALLKTISPAPSTHSKFQRFFISFFAQKHGFIFGCWPFIGLDGCHLKGKFPGVITAATAIDANFGVFPVAVAICEVESKSSWGWFLRHLYEHIGLDDNRRLTFMTDRQKRVIDAIEMWWPGSNHVTNNISECFNNWIDKFRGQPALTLLENMHRAIMKRIHKRHEDAKKWSTVIPRLVMKKMTENQDDGRFVQVICAGEFEYEVKDKNTYYNVHLDLKTCNYRSWAISGIPCKHAMAVITNTRRQWHEPRKNRKRAPDEPAKQKRSSGEKCSGCGAFGHNVRSCKTKEGNANQGSSVRALPQATQASQAAQTYQGAPISQPITHNAPLYTTAMLLQSCQSKSNPGTVAGLDVDWCGGLKVMMVDLVDAFAYWIFVCPALTLLTWVL